MAENLRKTLLDTIEIQEDGNKKFERILKQQTKIFVALVFMMFVAMAVFVAIITRPIHVDRELLQHMEQERAYIVQEKRRQDHIESQLRQKEQQTLEDRKILNNERATIIMARAQLVEAQRLLTEQQKALKK